MADRPNVLFVVADQQQGRTLDPDAGFHTPNLDALAADGVSLTGAHCTHPQCSPSRSSLLTGRFPHQTGVYTLSNWGDFALSPDAPCVARAFREAGYETAYFGRWDLGDAADMGELGWDLRRNVDLTGTPGRGGKARDDVTTDEAVRYVRERDGDDPFFATVAFNLPHPDFFVDEAFADEFDPADVPLPESFDADRSDKPAFVRERAAEFDLSAAEVREMGYRYRTMTARVDAYVGRLVEALREAGVYGETVVVFTADHGDMQGAHGLAKKGTFAYDELLRVPLVVRVPDAEFPREGVPDLVSTADLPGTLLEAAGVERPEGFGSLYPALERDSRPAEERVFFEHKYAYWGEHPLRGVRTRTWKYVDYAAEGEAELYDVEGDPDEVDNLADDPGYRDVRADLAALVEDWWDATDGPDDWWTETETY
ncbi:MAG: sulfatase [Halobacteriaceae archaeon]